MLSAVVSLCTKDVKEADADPAVAVARSLNGLVPAMVEGLLADVTIAGPAGLGLAMIADYAGCGCVEGDCEESWLSAALSRAKGSHLLVLRAGFLPGIGFAGELRDCLAGGQPRGVFRALPEHWHERLTFRSPLAASIDATIRWRALPAQDFHRMTRHLKLPVRRTRMHRGII